MRLSQCKALVECLALDSVKLNNEIVDKYKRFGLIESEQSNVGMPSTKFSKIEQLNS